MSTGTEIEIERLTADNKRMLEETALLLSDPQAHPECQRAMAVARAAGYEAGQKAMRERLACEFDGPPLALPRAAAAIRAFPILPEPQEPQP